MSNIDNTTMLPEYKETVSIIQKVISVILGVRRFLFYML